MVVFNPTHPKTNEIKIEIIYLDLANLARADVQGTIFHLNLFILKIGIPNLLVTALMVHRLIVVKKKAWKLFYKMTVNGWHLVGVWSTVLN